MRFEFVILGLPPITLNGSQGSWRKKAEERRKWRTLAINAIVLNGWNSPPLTKAKITYIRHSFVEPDFDNLAGSFKPIQDGMVKAGVLIDDKPAVIGRPEYQWKKVKPKQGKVEIIVENIKGET